MPSKARSANWFALTAYAEVVTVASLKWNSKISLSAPPATLNDGCGSWLRPKSILKPTSYSSKTPSDGSKVISRPLRRSLLFLPLDPRSKLSHSGLAAVTDILQQNLLYRRNPPLPRLYDYGTRNSRNFLQFVSLKKCLREPNVP